MENLRVLKNYEAMTDEELIKSIDDKLSYLLEVQEGILTQQEILHIKSLSMEELMQLVLENQKKQTEQINKLMERWDR